MWVRRCYYEAKIAKEDWRRIDEESENGNLENQIEIQYWFPNNGNPNNSTSTFTSESHLVDALLKSQEPTLIFTSKNYQPDYKIFLPQVFPLTFPFGVGGLEENRRTHVSVEECLKHYLNISLSMFQHSDIILLISHMYFRKKSFQSAYLKCKSRSSLESSWEYLEIISYDFGFWILMSQLWAMKSRDLNPITRTSRIFSNRWPIPLSPVLLHIFRVYKYNLIPVFTEKRNHAI